MIPRVGWVGLGGVVFVKIKDLKQINMWHIQMQVETLGPQLKDSKC